MNKSRNIAHAASCHSPLHVSIRLDWVNNSTQTIWVGSDIDAAHSPAMSNHFTSCVSTGGPNDSPSIHCSIPLYWSLSLRFALHRIASYQFHLFWPFFYRYCWCRKCTAVRRHGNAKTIVIYHYILNIFHSKRRIVWVPTNMWASERDTLTILYTEWMRVYVCTLHSWFDA